MVSLSINEILFKELAKTEMQPTGWLAAVVKVSFKVRIRVTQGRFIQQAL